MRYIFWAQSTRLYLFVVVFNISNTHTKYWIRVYEKYLYRIFYVRNFCWF